VIVEGGILLAAGMLDFGDWLVPARKLSIEADSLRWVK
jgi:hypothetical protein